jgi:hypothetical protein
MMTGQAIARGSSTAQYRRSLMLAWDARTPKRPLAVRWDRALVVFHPAMPITPPSSGLQGRGPRSVCKLPLTANLAGALVDGDVIRWRRNARSSTRRCAADHVCFWDADRAISMPATWCWQGDGVIDQSRQLAAVSRSLERLAALQPDASALVMRRDHQSSRSSGVPSSRHARTRILDCLIGVVDVARYGWITRISAAASVRSPLRRAWKP